MSIPKEPRQLMINLMYLVLTALLALNVSAEVMNAFFTLDKGNNDTMKIVNDQLDESSKALDELLKDDSKAKFRPIQPAIKAVREKVSAFNTYISDLRNLLIDQSGDANGKVDEGDFKAEHAGELPYIRGKKNKDVTTRLLSDGDKGVELKTKIEETRQALVESYTNLLKEHGSEFDLKPEDIESKITNIATNMPFKVDMSQVPKGKTWEEFKFRQMPVAAVLPLMSQMQSDLKASEANMVNDMIQLAGGKSIVFDKFFPVVQADRSYVIGGEKINATISIGSYSSSLDPKNVKMYVGGKAMNLNEDGTLEYTITASGTGQKKLPLKVEVTNPLTGKTTGQEGEFVYEVGTRSVAVSADKMNVFYIGVENPLTISASGVSSNDVKVSSTGGINISGSGSKRKVTAKKPGEATIKVSANGKILGSFPFRVKRIPDPVASLNPNKKVSGGPIGSGEFKAYRGIFSILENFDFAAKCLVKSFDLVYVPKRQDPVPSKNSGASYNQKSKRLVKKAKPGDIFYFDNVKTQCPGDVATRKINTMVFKIR